MKRFFRQYPMIPYFLIAALCFTVAVAIGWSPLATQIDNYHYDWTMRLYAPSEGAKEAVLLEFDDLTLMRHGGIVGMRRTLAQALDKLASVKPKAVAVDIILADPGRDEDDKLLAGSFSRTPNLVLGADLIPNADQWEQPYPAFLPYAKGVGHVHAETDRYDGVSRQVQLEKVGAQVRHWALALEALRVARQVDRIVETPRDLEIGNFILPVPKRGEQGRLVFIRYRREAMPRVPIRELLENPAAVKRLDGKVVFVGVTSQSQMRDRLVTPYSAARLVPGVEIHAHIYETLAQEDILQPASNISVVLAAVVLAAATALIFSFLTGWQAYALGGVQILWAHALPHTLFGSGVIFPLLAPAGTAWLAVMGCSAWMYFIVRRQLTETEADRSRYQQAIRFVSHEMKSPLTAIQGSSEMMSRYNLNEDKRKQMSQMINAESKRMARMIQTYLDVERLSAGQMELKKELFDAADLTRVCVERAAPLAEKKHIAIDVGELAPEGMVGDRELMEYAVYNLLTNAVKYSPAETRIAVEARRQGELVCVSVRDQGMGMDEKELKQIGTKFFRTRRAEQSGEMGTGIGLSIVNEIVHHHGGKMDVTSAPGKGSCFTIRVPAATRQPV